MGSRSGGSGRRSRRSARLRLSTTPVHDRRRDAAGIPWHQPRDSAHDSIPAACSRACWSTASTLGDPRSATTTRSSTGRRSSAGSSPGVTLAQAQAALGPMFHQFVSSVATTEEERKTLPALLVQRRVARARQPAAAVLEAAVLPDDAGRPDPGDRVREPRQPAAGAGGRTPPRDGGAAEPGRRARADRPPTADGVGAAGGPRRRCSGCSSPTGASAG